MINIKTNEEKHMFKHSVTSLYNAIDFSLVHGVVIS